MEIWKDIIGFNKYYQISNEGSIRSLDRKIKQRTGKIMQIKGHLIKARDNGKGYKWVELSKNKI